MPLNPDYVGREYPGSEPYEVGREQIRRFAEAIGDTNPIYVDQQAAKAAGHPDVIAPPTFLTVLSFRYAMEGPMVDPGLGVEYAFLVHGEQKFVHHRPVRAGDWLTQTTRIAEIRDVGRNEVMTMQSEVTTTSGEKVATIFNTVVIRGTAASAKES